MKTVPSRSILIVALVGLLAVACTPSIEQPQVWLDGARLVSLGFRGGVVDVELGVHNPNGFRLRTSGLTYDLDFEGSEAGTWLDFVEGRLEEQVQVDPGDTVRVVIPVEFDYRSLDGALREMLTRGSFTYRVRGLVAVEQPLQRDIRYQHSGTITPGGVR